MTRPTSEAEEQNSWGWEKVTSNHCSLDAGLEPTEQESSKRKLKKLLLQTLSLRLKQHRPGAALTECDLKLGRRFSSATVGHLTTLWCWAWCCHHDVADILNSQWQSSTDTHRTSLLSTRLSDWVKQMCALALSAAEGQLRRNTICHTWENENSHKQGNHSSLKSTEDVWGQQHLSYV